MSFPIPILPQAWRVPDDIVLTGEGQLIYRNETSQQRARITPAYEGMLDRFLKLATAPDQQIKEYADDYGVLKLCVHGRPAHWHRTGVGKALGSQGLIGGIACTPVLLNHEADLNKYVELTQSWRTIARAFAALIRAAHSIADGGLTDAETRNALTWFDDGGFYYEGFDKSTVKAAANHLFAQSVRLEIDYTEASRLPRLQFAGSSLADALAVQTALFITGASSAYVCDGCNSIFIPTRQPRYGQAKYCKVCRDGGVPQKVATREFRKRQRRENGNG